MSFDDPLDRRETNSSTNVLALAVEALKRRKEPLRVRHIETRTIVAHEENRLTVPHGGTDLHVWVWRLRGELPRIADQVVEQDAHETAIGIGHHVGMHGRTELA